MFRDVGLKARLLFRKQRHFRYNVYRITGVVPLNIRLYELALIHKSASLKLPDGQCVNNERLEFLGDAILDAVVAEFLFNHYVEKDEGFLTEMRAKIVNRDTLNRLAGRIGIKSLIVSKVNEQRSKNYKGDALEALIGALFLDKGFRSTRRFLINRIIEKHIQLNKLESKTLNYKSRIIEWSQKHKEDIKFEIIEEDITNGYAPVFISQVRVANKIAGVGKGNSKKEAEQMAAKQALQGIEENH